jgi:hypothetical protein
MLKSHLKLNFDVRMDWLRTSVSTAANAVGPQGAVESLDAMRQREMRYGGAKLAIIWWSSLRLVIIALDRAASIALV